MALECTHKVWSGSRVASFVVDTAVINTVCLNFLLFSLLSELSAIHRMPLDVGSCDYLRHLIVKYERHGFGHHPHALTHPQTLIVSPSDRLWLILSSRLIGLFVFKGMEEKLDWDGAERCCRAVKKGSFQAYSSCAPIIHVQS